MDAHTDLQDEVLGSKIAHGTPFKRAYDEDLLDCSRVIQIGLRGTGYSSDDYIVGRSMVSDKLPCYIKLKSTAEKVMTFVLVGWPKISKSGWLEP